MSVTQSAAIRCQIPDTGNDGLEIIAAVNGAMRLRGWAVQADSNVARALSQAADDGLQPASIRHQSGLESHRASQVEHLSQVRV